MTPAGIDAPGLLAISDVAQQSGEAPSVIRFYERKGLIASSRTASNHRRYDASTPCVVRFARVAQRIGLSVREIAGLLQEVPSAPTPADWQRLAERLAADAERRIAELHGVLGEMRSDTKLCELSGR